MVSKTRISALVLVALLLFGAQFAAAASAVEFKAGAYPAQLTGFQTANMKFGFENNLTTECEAVKMKHPKMEGAVSTLQFSVNYHDEAKGCSGLGFKNATISMNGCEYLFHIEAGMGDNFSGTMDIVCSGGKSITIVANTCEVTIGAQNGLGPISFTRNTASDDVTFGFAVVGSVAYTKVKDGILCPLSGVGAKANGDITGSATVHGENPENQNPYLFYAE